LSTHERKERKTFSRCQACGKGAGITAPQKAVAYAWPHSCCRQTMGRSCHASWACVHAELPRATLRGGCRVGDHCTLHAPCTMQPIASAACGLLLQRGSLEALEGAQLQAGHRQQRTCDAGKCHR
jgi:hypothetical protein